MQARRWLTLGLLFACSKDELPAAISATSSAEVGLIPQSSKVVGHDGGRSAMMFGRSVWIYGDTFLGVPDTNGSTFHSNSFAWTDDVDPSNGIGDFQERLDSAGAPMPFFPATPDEAAYNIAHKDDGARYAIWPLGMAFDATRSRGIVFYEVEDAKPGAWNFHGIGRGVAVWTDFTKPPERTALFAESEPTYGEGVIIDGDSLFTFACAGGGLDAPKCTLARALLDKVTDRSAYEYWNGASWSKAIGDARAVLEAGSGLTILRRDTTFIATYTRSLDNQVVLRTAPALTGPWSDEAKLFVANRKGDKGWTYDAYPHAELGTKPLYFSFTRPTGTFSSETAFVRVDVD